LTFVPGHNIDYILVTLQHKVATAGTKQQPCFSIINQSLSKRPLNRAHTSNKAL